jgi:hypothetical protein
MSDKKIQWVDGTQRPDDMILTRTDTVTGTAGAFVNDHRLGRLPTITYINFL